MNAHDDDGLDGDLATAVNQLHEQSRSDTLPVGLDMRVLAEIDAETKATGFETVASPPRDRLSVSRMFQGAAFKYGLAASLLAVVVGGLALLGIPVGGANLYAQAARRLHSVESMVFKVQFSPNEWPIESSGNRYEIVRFRAPGKHRVEDPQTNTIQIIDRNLEKLLILNANDRQAIVFEGPIAAAMDRQSPARLIEVLLKHIRSERSNATDLETLGKRQIGDSKLEGFRSRIGAETVTAWIDTKTGLPFVVAVRFEFPSSLSNGQAAPMWQIMTEFQFDTNLAVEQFSTSVPENYETLSVDKEAIDLSPATLDDLLVLLRRCAEVNDLQFPRSLSIQDEEGTPMSIQNQYAERLERSLENASDDEKSAAISAMLEFGQAMGRSQRFLLSLKQENDLQYFGGVRLGEPERPLLWYSPKGDDRYVLVDADLSVRDVDRTQLPEAPEAPTRREPAKNFIRVSTPRFELPTQAIRSYSTLQDIRRRGKQDAVEYLSLGWMPEFVENSASVPPDGKVELKEVDPSWKPDRQTDSSRFAFLSEFPNLKGVDLSHLYLTQSDLDVVASCSQIERLCLSGVMVLENQPRRLVASDLRRFSSLRRLQLLDLSQANFVGGLVHLGDLPNLRTLYLSSFEHLHDASVSELRLLPHLETLVLAPVFSTNPNTTVTEAGLKSLQEIPNLKLLFVGEHGKWTLPVERLRQILPDVDVRAPHEGHEN
ncbi:MAG: hypothetical protein AAF989_13340 [Planctomycetota bacterium]